MKSNIFIPQSPNLNTLIRSIWQQEGNPAFSTEKIIPKGVTEIIFNLQGGQPVNTTLGDSRYLVNRCVINGYNKAPIEISLPQKQFFFGVQLQPAAIKHLLKIPACEFADMTVDLTLIDPAFRMLWQQLAEAKDFDCRVAVISNWAQKSIFNWDAREKLLNDFLCARHGTNVTVPVLAKEMCFSPRHLSRKIFDITGMNTEEILRYKKYLHAVQLMHDTNASLTEIAYACNFNDQSHFIKSFSLFAQMKPGEYRRDKSRLPGHLFKDVR